MAHQTRPGIRRPHKRAASLEFFPVSHSRPHTTAPQAAIDHMRDWALGTNGKWVTMGIPSDGQYGIPKDVMFGFPVTCENGEYKLVEGLEIDAFSQERINKTLEELQGEQDGVKHLL